MDSGKHTLRNAPGRPRGFDEERALEAAVELFWSKGFRNATTRDLESASGLTSSSLYNAFGSKQALFATALARYQSRITASLVGPLENDTEGLPALDRFFEELRDWLHREGRRGCMLVNMMAEDAGTTEEFASMAASYRARVERAFATALQRAADAGDVAPAGIEGRASLLLAQVLGINIAARAGATMEELTKLVGAARQQIAEWRLHR